MDLKKIGTTIWTGLKKFGRWLYPYLKKIHHWRKRLWKKYQINKIILLTGLVAVLVTTIYLFYLSNSADVASLNSGMEESTHINDNDVDDAGTLYGQKGTFTKLESISANIQKAVVTTEDKRFYELGAYDLKG